jgi:hypothetical protein
MNWIKRLFFMLFFDKVELLKLKANRQFRAYLLKFTANSDISIKSREYFYQGVISQ